MLSKIDWKLDFLAANYKFAIRNWPKGRNMNGMMIVSSICVKKLKFTIVILGRIHIYKLQTLQWIT